MVEFDPGEAQMTLPIAERWYDSRPLDHGITLIDERHVDRIARSNIWLVAGRDRDLLVDSGTGLGPLAETVAQLTPRPVIAVATLGYYDHAGGLFQFEERAIHRLDAPRVAAPTPRRTVSDKYLVDANFTAVPHAGFRAADYAMPPRAPTRLLEDGEVIDLGGRRFEVQHLPGVTDGAIGLFEAASGSLFTGDAFSYGDSLYDGEPADETGDADRAAFRRSLARMRSLAVATVYPGHYAPFTGTRLREIIDGYLAA